MINLQGRSDYRVDRRWYALTLTDRRAMRNAKRPPACQNLLRL